MYSWRYTNVCTSTLYICSFQDDFYKIEQIRHPTRMSLQMFKEKYYCNIRTEEKLFEAFLINIVNVSGHVDIVLKIVELVRIFFIKKYNYDA